MRDLSHNGDLWQEYDGCVPRSMSVVIGVNRKLNVYCWKCWKGELSIDTVCVYETDVQIFGTNGDKTVSLRKEEHGSR